MRAGRLRHFVSLQQRVETKNDMGEVTWAWDEVCQIWAEISGLTGREMIAAQQVQSQVSHNILIRWRAGVTAKMRVVEVCEPSVQYDIVAVLPNARRTETRLMCLTRDAEGWRG
jgi:SPP1 family predicted phage head-tail adaptor